MYRKLLLYQCVETKSCYIVKAGLKLAILLPWFPKCWDYSILCHDQPKMQLSSVKMNKQISSTVLYFCFPVQDYESDPLFLSDSSQLIWYNKPSYFFFQDDLPNALKSFTALLSSLPLHVICHLCYTVSHYVFRCFCIFYLLINQPSLLLNSLSLSV